MIFSPEIEEFLQKYDRIFLDERGIIKLHPDDFYKTIDNADLENFSLLKEGLPAEAIAELQLL